jgi:hypothetical protein
MRCWHIFALIAVALVAACGDYRLSVEPPPALGFGTPSGGRPGVR